MLSPKFLIYSLVCGLGLLSRGLLEVVLLKTRSVKLRVITGSGVGYGQCQFSGWGVGSRQG